MLLDNMITCAPPHSSTQSTTAPADSASASGKHSDANTQKASTPDCHPASRDTAHSEEAQLRGSTPTSSLAQSTLGHEDDSAADTGTHALNSRLSSHSQSGSSSAPTAASAAATLGGESFAASGQAAGGKEHDDKSVSPHQAAIQQAVEHWACRLEMSPAGKAAKPKAKRHLSRRQRAHIRHAVEQQNQIDDVAGEHDPSVCSAVYVFEGACLGIRSAIS